MKRFFFLLLIALSLITFKLEAEDLPPPDASPALPSPADDLAPDTDLPSTDQPSLPASAPSDTPSPSNSSSTDSNKLNIESLAGRGWPPKLEPGDVQPVRNVLSDPRRKPKPKPDEKVKPEPQQPVTPPPSTRIETSINQQVQAWTELTKLLRLTSIYQTPIQNSVAFQMKDSGKIHVLKLNQGYTFRISNPKTKKPSSSSPSPISALSKKEPPPFSLETITLKLIAIQPKALHFQVEELNGITFFADEQPIWSYEIGSN